jgi:hypothetical protein
MKKADFVQHDTYELALADTAEDLAPLAVMLKTVGSLPDVDAELSESYHDSCLVCMTTRYADKKYNGQLGWMHLPSDTKGNIASMLFDNGIIDEWVYFSQKWAE